MCNPAPGRDGTLVRMAAKKTRKRAYIPPSSEVVNRRERTESTRTHRSTATRQQRGGSAGKAYVYPVPSWKRTAKRLPIYFVLIFALQYYLLGSGEKPLAGSERLTFAAMQAGLVTLCFAPFMHMMDRFAYNRYLKRSGAAAAKPASKG